MSENIFSNFLNSLSDDNGSRKPKVLSSHLDSSMKEFTIMDMNDGDSGYTVPWGMFADSDGKLYLNGNYTIHGYPGGTVCMMVARISGEYYVAQDTIGDYKYSCGKAYYVGGSNGVPVSLTTKREILDCI